MGIIVNLDVMMAKRKISLTELANQVDLTQANLSILKNNKAKAIRFSTLESICEVDVYKRQEVFTSLFQVILTDRGSEFTNPLAIEFNKGNGRRTHIFYCDPQRSDQKGGCEVTHEMIRRVLPKKTSFDNLTQDDINLMTVSYTHLPKNRNLVLQNIS